MNYRPIIAISGLILLTAGILFFTQPENKSTEVKKPVAQTQVKNKPVEPPKLVDDDEVEAKLNQFRASKGLSQLADNPTLDAAAQERAEYLCANNSFEHTGWRDTFKRYYNRFSYAGENLYYGTLREGQADDAINGWVNSPSHLKNIVGNYVDMGMGVKLCSSYQGEQNVVIITNYFRLP